MLLIDSGRPRRRERNKRANDNHLELNIGAHTQAFARRLQKLDAERRVGEEQGKQLVDAHRQHQIDDFAAFVSHRALNRLLAYSCQKSK